MNLRPLGCIEEGGTVIELQQKQGVGILRQHWREDGTGLVHDDDCDSHFC